MTPEERFTKIENAIQSLTEMQAHHDTQMSGLIALVEKQNDGIGGLIVVSRTLVDSQKELREAQRATDTRLQALIETVDQLSRTVDTFVKGLQKPNGNQ